MPSDKELCFWMLAALVGMWGVFLWMLWAFVTWNDTTSLEDLAAQLRHNSSAIRVVAVLVLGAPLLMLTRFTWLEWKARRGKEDL
jgi:hypothetical protein